MIRLAGYISGIAVSVLLLGAAVDRESPDGSRAEALKAWVASRVSEVERWIGRTPGPPEGAVVTVEPTRPDREDVSPRTDSPGGAVEPVGTAPESLPPASTPGEAHRDVPGIDVGPAQPETAPVTPERPAVASVEAAVDPRQPRPVTVGGEHWQALWIPFRSRASARGFAGRVSRLTSVPVKVEPADRGYQVMFAYRGADERESTLARIASATGLRLEEH